MPKNRKKIMIITLYSIPTEYVDEETAVRAGAAFLDVKNPGWAAKIEVEAISIFSPSACILGQLYGGYNEGMAQLGLTRIDDELLGFEYYGYPVDIITACDRLNELWKAEIYKRLPA